jgi:hypothetical protein
MLGLLVVMLISLGFLAESNALTNGRKWFLPHVLGPTNPSDTLSEELRVDNIQSYNLDAALYNFGITNASTRAAVYQWIMNDRNGQGAAPDGYPSPQATPDWFTFRQFCGCQLGQGFLVGWKGSGHMQSHFRDVNWGLFGNWSFGVFCPINFICTVITKKGPTINNPEVRHWLEYEIRASHAPVQWINQMCSF